MSKTDELTPHIIPNDEQCALATRLYEARGIYLSDACQILAERDWEVYHPMFEERDDLREYLNTEIATNSELGDELLAERATFAEFRKHAWEEQEKLRAEVERLKSARYKYQDDPEMIFDEDLGWVHVTVQQEFKDLRAELAAMYTEAEKLQGELATQKVQNNHNWQFQEISETALKRAETAETKLAGLRSAVIEAYKNAQIRPIVWYPENTRSYIHPNDLGKINETQTNACVAAIEAALDGEWEDSP